MTGCTNLSFENFLFQFFCQSWKNNCKIQRIHLAVSNISAKYVPCMHLTCQKNWTLKMATLFLTVITFSLTVQLQKLMESMCMSLYSVMESHRIPGKETRASNTFLTLSDHIQWCHPNLMGSFSAAFSSRKICATLGYLNGFNSGFPFWNLLYHCVPQHLSSTIQCKTMRI